MILRLEAYRPAEGVGIVRTDQALRLVQPPYLLSKSPLLPEDSLQDAVLKHGFFASQQDFTGWGDLIDFLNSQVLEVRRSLGKQITLSPSGQELLDVATPDVLNGYLDRVESELIPSHLFDHAESLLLALLASKPAAVRPDIVGRTAKLLQDNKQARQRSRASLAEVAKRDARFPSLEKHGLLENSIRWSKVFQAQHSLFAPVA